MTSTVSTSSLLPLLSVQDVLAIGLELLKITPSALEAMSQEKKLHLFRKHFGLLPQDVAEQWHDLTVTTILLAKLAEEEKTMKGFRASIMAHGSLGHTLCGWLLEHQSLLGSPCGCPSPPEPVERPTHNQFVWCANC